MIDRFNKLCSAAVYRCFMPILLLTFLSWAQAAPPPAPAGTPIQLPELPSNHERNPQFWDEYGCIISDEKPLPGIPTCQESARMMAKIAKVQPQRVLSPDELNKSKRLRGFEGPYFTPQPSANAVVVLPETITTSIPPGGGFAAVGLVRNELPNQLIGEASITAELMNEAGQVIGKATTEAMVTPIRPGEPVPFQLTAPIPFKDVVDVRWNVIWQIETNTAKAAYRDVEVGMYNHGPQSWGERKSGPTEWDVPGEPFAYLDEGTVQNLSQMDIPNPEMTVAWYTETKGSSGKIVKIETMPLYLYINDKPVPAQVLNGISPSGNAVGSLLNYAILIKDRNFANQVDAWKIRKMIWVTGGGQ